MTPTITLLDQLTEAKRELAMRKKVYPAWLRFAL